MEERNVRFDVPIWHKLNLSIEEVVKYSGIGRAKVYEMTNREDCPLGWKSALDKKKRI